MYIETVPTFENMKRASTKLAQSDNNQQAASKNSKAEDDEEGEDPQEGQKANEIGIL